MDFSEFVDSPEFRQLTEEKKPQAIQRFFDAAAEQHPESREKLVKEGEALGRIQTFRTEAQFGAEATRDSFRKLAFLEAENLTLADSVENGSLDRAAAIDQLMRNTVEKIDIQRKNFTDTGSTRDKLAQLYVLSGQSDFVDQEALTGRDKKLDEFNKLLKTVEGQGVTRDVIAKDAGVLTGNFEGDFGVTSSGYINAKPTVFFNDRETIVNKVNASNLNKYQREQLLAEIDDRRENFAKFQLDALDSAVNQIATSRVGLGLMSQKDYADLLEKGEARGHLEGETDVQKLENYVKMVRQQKASTAASNIAGNVSELNKASNSALSALLALNPARLFSEDANNANREIQEINAKARQGFDTIIGFNESILNLNDSGWYRFAKTTAGATPTLALMLATGGTTAGAARAGVARLGGGVVSQRLAFGFGGALAGTNTTFNETLTNAQISDDPRIRERAAEFAFKSAAIEQLVTTAFGAIPGFEGVEASFKSMLTKAGGAEAFKKSVTTTIGKFNAAGGVVIKGAAGEIAEEEIILALDSFIVQSQQNPNLTVDDFKRSLTDAALTSGFLGGSFNIKQQVQTTQEFNRARKEAAAAIPEADASDADVRDSADKAADDLRGSSERTTDQAEPTQQEAETDERIRRALLAEKQDLVNKESGLNDQDVERIEQIDALVESDTLLTEDSPQTTEEAVAEPEPAPEDPAQPSDTDPFTQQDPDDTQQPEAPEQTDSQDSENSQPQEDGVLQEGDQVFSSDNGILYGVKDDGETFVVAEDDPSHGRAQRIVDQGGSVLDDSTPQDQRESTTLEGVADVLGRDDTSSLTDQDKAEIIEEYRDTVFETLDTFDGDLDVDIKNSFSRAISDAADATALKQIEDTLIGLNALEQDTSSAITEDGDFTPMEFDDGDTDVERVEVESKRFLEVANQDQKNEFYERVGVQGEQATDVATDIANRDGVEGFLTDEQLIEGVDTTGDGNPDVDDTDTDVEQAPRRPVKLYSGLFFADPDFWIDSAQNLYRTGQSIGQFAKKMVALLGSKVIPVIRNFYNDLVRNEGEVKNAQKGQRKNSGPRPTKSDEDLQQSAQDRDNEGLDTTQVSEDSPILIPDVTTSKSTQIGQQVSGLSSVIGLGRLANTDPIRVVAKAFGADVDTGTTIAGQISKMLSDNFISRAFLEWNHDYSQARQKASFIADQIRGFQPFLKRNKEGEFLSVTAKADGPQSLHPSDVIEAMMEDIYAYDAPREFRQFVAVWKNIRKELITFAAENNVTPKFLLDQDGDVDLERLTEDNALENFYFPRGRVRLVGENRSSGSNGGRLTDNPSQFKRSRKIENEGDADANIEYFQDPIDRIEDFAASVYRAVSNRRLATNPDLAKNARTRGRNAETTLSSQKVNIGSTSFVFKNENAEALNSLIDDRIRSAEKTTQAVSNVANTVRALSFTGDFSALGIQLFYLSAKSPIRFAKAAGQAFASMFTPKFTNKYIQDNAAVVKEITELGGNFNSLFEDMQFLADTNASDGFLRRGGAFITKPFTTFHRTASNIGAIEMYKALRSTAVNKDGSLDLEKAATLVQFADRTAGRENLAKNGVTATKRELFSILSSAPSMYIAFTNLMGSTLSSNKFERNQALVNHGRFLFGASLMTMTARMIASAFDEDQEGMSLMERIEKASNVLNPSSTKEFMRISVPIGNKRTTISMGGFFRSAFAMSGKIYNDPSNALTHVGQFLGTRKSPGVSTAIELYTKKDFFDRDVTTAETLIKAALPVALKDPGLQVSQPFLEKIPDWSGGRIEGVSLTTEPPKTAGENLREIAFSVMGFNAFTESSSGKYRREVDALSFKKHKKNYHDLTFEEKVGVVKEADAIGIKVERMNGRSADFMKFMTQRMKSNISDSRVTTSLDKLDPNALASIATTMKWGVKLRDDSYVRFSSEDSRDMHKEFAKKINSYVLSEIKGKEDTVDMKKEFRPAVKALWNDTLTEFGYPAEKKRRR